MSRLSCPEGIHSDGVDVARRECSERRKCPVRLAEQPVGSEMLSCDGEQMQEKTRGQDSAMSGARSASSRAEACTRFECSGVAKAPNELTSLS